MLAEAEEIKSFLKTFSWDKMELDVATRTVIPILLLMGLGFLSRKLGILKSGDERILSAYIYYFALQPSSSANKIRKEISFSGLPKPQPCLEQEAHF